MSDYGDDDGGYAEEAYETYEDYRVSVDSQSWHLITKYTQQEERVEEQEERDSSDSSSDHEDREDRPYYEQEAAPQVRQNTQSDNRRTY